ncbi:SCP2 sterol-binding domain-containing protein [Celeribacter arenosi]|uniref:SCP2 domain-containing protein n=1 Tax=Celeribacter arenosi TaxID=792649 RepID=A0ABP7KF38_9RHOB
MTFLETACVALNERLKGHTFEKTVSLRIKEVGNIFISGSDAVVSDERADSAVISDQVTLQKILNGDLHPMKAILFGKMKIAGDAKTAAKFGSLFG